MRVLTGIAALAALALLSALAVQRGAADLIAFSARYGLDRAGLPTIEASERARRRLERAIELDGGNADHHEYLARWYAHAGAHRHALEHLRISVQARPSWPYAWAQLGQAKLRLGEYDAELNRAVQQAVRLGPWEPVVQLAVAELAMAGDSRLAPQTRHAALRIMSNGLKSQERAIAELAVRSGRLDLLCEVPGIVAYRAALRCI